MKFQETETDYFHAKKKKKKRTKDHLVRYSFNIIVILRDNACTYCEFAFMRNSRIQNCTECNII